MTSSDSSSSISVVSVPFEVTGEGPTRSLGLTRLGLPDSLWTLSGRRDWVSGGGDALNKDIRSAITITKAGEHYLISRLGGDGERRRY